MTADRPEPPPLTRDSWPEPPAMTEAGAVMTDVVLTTFRLNARLMEVAQDLAMAGGLTVVAGPRRRHRSAAHRRGGRSEHGDDPTRRPADCRPAG